MRMIDGDRLLRELTALSHGQVWPGWTYEGIRLLIERQPTLTPPNEPERAGLYGKYTVYKNKDGSLVTDCFILRPAKDPAAVAALRAYAATTDNAELAADIINWVGAEPNEWVSVEERLPPEHEPVLCIVNGKPRPNIELEEAYQVGSWNGADGWIIEEWLDWEDADVLWWMPFPAPPDRRPPEGEEDT